MDLDRGTRTVLLQRVDRPARVGAARIMQTVLLPYSLFDVGGTLYIETNTAHAVSDGGGHHVLPTYGLIGEEVFSERAFGIGSTDVPQGTTKTEPLHSVIHKQGWI